MYLNAQQTDFKLETDQLIYWIKNSWIIGDERTKGPVIIGLAVHEYSPTPIMQENDKVTKSPFTK